MEKGHSLDMTQGNALGLLVRFSLPLLAGNALQQLYNMVDSVVVGRFVGEAALAAVGAGFPIIFMLSSLFMGIGTGAMVMVSQFFGGGEKDNLRKTIDTVYTALIVGVLPLSVLGVLMANPLLDLVSIPPDARHDTWVYLVIVMGGLIGSLGYNINAGILQGLGDSKTPLLFLSIACVLNIVLDLLLVLVFPLGVAGVAIATIAAQMFSWIFGIFYINRKYPDIQIHPFSMRFSRRLFKEVMRLGLPSGIQMSLFSIATLFVTRLVNTYGTTFAAGFGAANKLDTFIFLPIQSISNAVTTFAGQNIGSGRPDRVKQGARAAIGISLAFSALGLLVIPLGPTMMRLFSDEPAVIEAGMAFLNRIVPFYWMLAIVFVLNSVIRGAGEPMLPTVSSIISLVLARLPASYLLAHLFGRDNLNFGYMVGWAIGLFITVPYYLSGKWKNKGITRAGSSAKG